jgi:DHA2 family multidrug resistance protein
MFGGARQGLATTLAGVLAVLAPTLGPVVGGWITETWTWRWLFLINTLPGLVCALSAPMLLPVGRMDLPWGRRLDVPALALMAGALAALEIGVKEAPGHGWGSPLVLSLLGGSALSGAAFAWRSLRSAAPVVRLQTLAQRDFAIGCLLSFTLGMGLFGSVYLMPVFLGFVRGHDALRIGEIMLLSGLAQLITAPIAVALERRADARLVAAAGFALFAAGLAMSTRQTGDTDFQDMIWPQIMRGAAIMLCLLAPTRMALGRLPLAEVADASGLFNLMRNLGGAIGIALIDTVIYGRSPVLARAIVRRLEAGDVPTAKAVGLPLDLFLMQGPGPVDPATAAYLKPMVERLALVRAINEAWLMLAVLTALVLVSIPFARRPPSEADGSSAPPIDLEGLAAT